MPNAPILRKVLLSQIGNIVQFHFLTEADSLPPPPPSPSVKEKQESLQEASSSRENLIQQPEYEYIDMRRPAVSVQAKKDSICNNKDCMCKKQIEAVRGSSH